MSVQNLGNPGKTQMQPAAPPMVPCPRASQLDKGAMSQGKLVGRDAQGRQRLLCHL